MSLYNDEVQKRYYTISEVAAMFGVSASLIRFWENEFEFLRPHKTSKGDRRFTPDNLEQIRLIYHLVKERGFTLPGAKKEIVRQREWQQTRHELIQHLESLREQLRAFRASLDDPFIPINAESL